ncbi:formyl transferase [Cokeromyces recurvatus]|nr:formyl transferase [Cokeromyces recurvatus]KAI7908081.1 formyl transferase [Cokeromyces recurvatus]
MFKLISRTSFKINSSSFKYQHYYTTLTNNQKLRILFFGTDSFASTHLRALIKEKERQGSCIATIDLVCPPDRRTGRKLEKITPSETKEIAERNNIEIYHTPAGIKTLNDWTLPNNKVYDLGIVVSFGYFIPPHIISSLNQGAINVHPSLLPKYRGAAPIQHTILYGDSEAGVTIQELDDKEFDAGRILAQERISLLSMNHDYPVYSKLKETLAEIGSRLLIDTVCNLYERKQNAQKQDISQATKAPKVKKEWSELDFKNMSAWQAEQLNRAIGDQFPLRTTYHKKKKNLIVQLLDLHLLSFNKKETISLQQSEPGSFRWDEASKSLHIAFGDGSVIACSKLKVENKGIISATDFANGYQAKGQFGTESPLMQDDTIIKNNIKKRSKMRRFDDRELNKT